MKIAEFFKLALAYILIYLVATLVFILLFSVPLFNNIDVFFYKGIVLLLLSSIVTIGLGIIVKKFWLKDIMVIRDILLIFVVFCCVNMVFFTHLPVTAERSISVFILGYMSEEPGRIYTEEDIQEFFNDRYIDDYRAFEKRFHEQTVTGTIKAEGDGYVMTKRGKTLMKLYNFIADCFHIDKKLIKPQNHKEGKEW